MDVIALITAITGLITTIGNIWLFNKNSTSIDKLTDKLGIAITSMGTDTGMLNDRFAEVLDLFRELVHNQGKQ